MGHGRKKKVQLVLKERVKWTRREIKFQEGKERNTRGKKKAQ